MALTKKEWKAQRRATIKELREDGWDVEAIENYLESWGLDYYRYGSTCARCGETCDAPPGADGRSYCTLCRVRRPVAYQDGQGRPGPIPEQVLPGRPAGWTCVSEPPASTCPGCGQSVEMGHESGCTYVTFRPRHPEFSDDLPAVVFEDLAALVADSLLDDPRWVVAVPEGQGPAGVR